MRPVGSEVANGDAEERDDHNAHGGEEHLIDARRSLHTTQIQQGEQQGKRDEPPARRDSGKEIEHRLSAPDGADERVDHVVHGHAPAGDEAECRMDLAPDIGVRRARAGIDARHASVADGGEHHRDHADEDAGDHLSLAGVGEDAVAGHRRGGLDDDDAVHHQVPQAEGAFQTGRGGGVPGGCARHVERKFPSLSAAANHK